MLQPIPISGARGLRKEAADRQVDRSRAELEEVRWFTKDEARAVLAGSHEVKAPPKFAIARTLLEAWALGAGV